MSNQLPNISLSGLTYDNIMEDIKNILKNNPEYNTNWNDFLSSNAGRMILEMVSYIVEQLGVRIDVVVNELFITTAQQEESKRSFLKLLSYTPELPACSEVYTTATITKSYTKNIKFPYPLIINTTDNDGNSCSFELIKKNKDGKFEYPIYDGYEGHYTYFDVNNYNPLVNYVTFFEGTTLSQSYIGQGIDDEYIELGLSNVINNSLRLWKITRDISGIILTADECNLVDNLLSPAAQTAESFMPCKLSLQDNGTYNIIFGNKKIMISESEYRETTGDQISVFNPKLPTADDEFIIYYRIGGGSNKNITEGKLSTSRSFFDTENQTNISVTFYNEEEGKFGSNVETLDDSIAKAGILVTTNNRLVTKDDYNNIINNLSSVINSASYGHSNRPYTVYDLYGYEIRPLEVWNYIIPRLKSFDSKKTWEYQDFFRFSTRLQEVLDDKHAFSIGEKNLILKMGNPIVVAGGHKSTVILDKVLSKKFMNSDSTIKKIGTNNCYAVNKEGNEGNWEELNIKLYDNSSIENRFYEINADFTYTENLLDTDTNKYTLEIYNTDYIKLTLISSTALSQRYISYIYPLGYYPNFDNNRYVYIKNSNLYPKTISSDSNVSLKITNDRSNSRTFEKASSNYVNIIDYNIEFDDNTNYYKLIESSTKEFPDFSYFYCNYIIDNRGVDLDLYIEKNVNLNIMNLLDRTDFKLVVNFTINRKTYQEVLTNIAFYNTLTSLTPSNITGVTFETTDPVSTSWANIAYLKRVDGALIEYRTIINISTGTTNTLTLDQAFSGMATGSFSVINKLTMETIPGFINDKLEDCSSSYIKNNIRMDYNDSRQRLFFKIRGLNLDQNTGVVLKFTSSGDVNDLTFDTYFGAIGTLNSDINLNEISDVYEATNEYYFNSLLDDKKMICVDNIYKQTLFKTFDYKCKIVYKKNFNPDEIEKLVEKIIRDNYNIYKCEFSAKLNKNKIESLIYSIPGVKIVTTEYFGSDFNYSPNVDEIICEFDEVLIVSDNRYIDNMLETKDFQLNGIIINLTKEV